jgi:hypothetical protein
MISFLYFVSILFFLEEICFLPLTLASSFLRYEHNKVHVNTHPPFKCNTTLTAKTKEEIEFTSQVRMLMTTDEKILLYRHLQRAKTYLEFGAGGSTELACRVSNLEHFISVESSIEFLQGLVKNSTCLQESIKHIPHYADIGPTTLHGYPQNHNGTLLRRYSESLLLFKAFNPELILVDGRFRLACAFLSLLHLPQATIMIHDFFWRPYYYPVLDFMDLQECTGSLIVLRKKPDISKENLELAYHHFAETSVRRN